VGKIIYRGNKKAKASSEPTAPSPAPLGGGDEIAALEVSPETKLKNAAMAAALFGFCFGVAWYSMNSVGQAGGGGSSGDDISDDDPLAQLRREARQAQTKRDRETQTTDNAQDMLRQFQQGKYDPDSELEDDEGAKSNSEKGSSRRPWWKIW